MWCMILILLMFFRLSFLVVGILLIWVLGVIVISGFIVLVWVLMIELKVIEILILLVSSVCMVGLLFLCGIMVGIVLVVLKSSVFGIMNVF